MTDEEVFYFTVSAISHHRINIGLGIVFMNIDHLFEKITVIYGTSGYLSSSDHLVLRIYSAVGLVT